MDKLKYASQYVRDNAYPFPDEANPVKDEGYFLAACNAMCSKYFMNRCSLPYDGWGTRRSIAELRAYRHGRNNINKYKNWMIGLPDDSGQRKTTLNISWDMTQVLPQKCDAVLGFLMKNKYDINVQASDYEALMDKKTKVAIAKIVTDIRLGNMLTNINQNHTVNLAPPKPPVANNSVPINSPEDVDLAQSIGLFMLEEEASLENLIDTTRYISKTEGIEDLINDDLITCGYSARRVFTNPNSNEVEEGYVDIERAVFPHSQYRDYRDASWGGWWDRISISELRRTSTLTDKQIVEIASKYRDNNIVNFYTSLQTNNDQFDFRMIDQIQVDVFRGYWIGSKSKRVTSVTSKRTGSLVVNEVDVNYTLDKQGIKDGKTVDSYSNMTIYKASMVLGSAYAFDYGEDTDINYKTEGGKKWPLFPLKFTRTGSTSIVERSIPFVDDAQLIMLKLRVARAKMPAPPNLAIDKGALEGMKIDGVSYKPQQLLKILQDEGYLLMDTKNQWGQNQGAGRPVVPIGTDLMQMIGAWWEDMGRVIGMIEKVTGVNDIFAAQTPHEQTGLGVSKLLLEGAQNSLTPLINGMVQMTQATYEVVSSKWQCVAKYATPEQKKKLSISRSLEIVAVSEKIFDYDFDTQVVPGLNSSDKALMLENLMQMRNSSRQGGMKSMSESDMLIIENMIRSDKLKQAQIYTAFAVAKREQQDAQQQQQSIQMNGQMQQQSVAAKGQTDAQLNQQSAQQEAALQQQKLDAQMRSQIQLEILKGQNQLNKVKLESLLQPRKIA
jgi:hypothetical protein